MAQTHTIKPIARIKNGYSSKFGIPRQPGLVPEALSVIVFEEEYRIPEAIRGIEEYSHLWLIWQFSEAIREDFSPTVRPPRLGGNKRVGVFATRSPFRPNSLGLSSVKLIEVQHTKDLGDVLLVSGADLMDGTPIYDIKPYVRYSDSHPDAISGFADDFESYSLDVNISDEWLSEIPDEDKAAILGILSQDPRPSYQQDAERIYTFDYNGLSVSFKVSEKELTVTEIKKLN